MPMAIGLAVLAAIGATDATIVAGLTVAELVGSVILTAASIGISAVLMPKPPSIDERQQLTLRQPRASRTYFYGTNKISGVLVFLETRAGALYQCVALCSHQVSSFVQHWLADNQCTLDDSGNVTLPTQYTDSHGNYLCQIFTRSGTVGQAASTELISIFPDLWTSAHQGNGIADAVIVMKPVDANALPLRYPGGMQSYRAVINGMLVEDPRTSTTAFSKNAALVIRDYLMKPRSLGGAGVPVAYVTGGDTASWSPGANVCDQTVELLDGGTEPRYTLNGGYQSSDMPRDVLQKMLAPIDGWLFLNGAGWIGLDVRGAYSEPTVVITDDHILGMQLREGAGLLRTANQITASYTDPDNDYQTTDADPWRDEADIAINGELTANLDLNWCQSHGQCRRRMKIESYRKNPAWVGKLMTDAVGLDALSERFIRVQSNDFGIDAVFEVTSYKDNIAEGTVAIGISALDPAAWDWNPATDEGIAPAIPPANTNTDDIETPAGFTANVETLNLGNGVTAAAIYFGVTPPVDRNDLQLHIQIWNEADTSDTWYDVNVADGAYVGETGALSNGTYDARAWYRAPGGKESDYANLIGIGVNNADAAPSQPTNLTATASGSTVTVAMTAPNSPNVASCHVFRGAGGTSFSAATDISGAIYCAPNQNLSYPDTPGTGSWSYWAVAANAAGGESAPTGPANVTV